MPTEIQKLFGAFAPSPKIDTKAGGTGSAVKQGEADGTDYSVSKNGTPHMQHQANSVHEGVSTGHFHAYTIHTLI